MFKHDPEQMRALISSKNYMMKTSETPLSDFEDVLNDMEQTNPQRALKDFLLIAMAQCIGEIFYTLKNNNNMCKIAIVFLVCALCATIFIVVRVFCYLLWSLLLFIYYVFQTTDSCAEPSFTTSTTVKG